jgi:hypothetical protein
VDARTLNTWRAVVEPIFGNEATIDDDALDVLWVLYGPEAYSKLVGERGRDRARFVRVLAEVGRQLSVPRSRVRRAR